MTMHISGGYVMAAIVGVLICIPPKHDPSIKIKEWLENRKRK